MPFKIGFCLWPFQRKVKINHKDIFAISLKYPYICNMSNDKRKPTLVYMDDEEKKNANELKEHYGHEHLSQFIRQVLRTEYLKIKKPS